LATEEEKEELRNQNDLTIKRSDAQNNAYTQIAKGLKVLNYDRDGNSIKTGERPVYLYGLEIRKKIIRKGEYKPTKRQLKTVLKNEIMNKISNNGELKFNFKQFKIGNENEIKIQGVTI
jgi:hypothetical protein